MATTSAQYATTVVSTAPGSGSWANTANALGSASASFATWTAAANTNSIIVLGGFGLDALVPADATVNSLTVRTKHYVNSNTNISAASVLAQTASGTVSTNPALTRSTTSTNVSTNTLTGVTRAHLADLRISVRYQHANNTTSATANVDWVEVVVDYSPTQTIAAVGALASATTFGPITTSAAATERATPTTNLVGRWRADSAPVADGQVVTSLPSTTTGPTLGQSGTGPTRADNGIGGKPSLRFTGAQSLRTASGVGSGQPVTMSIVIRATVTPEKQVFNFGGVELIANDSAYFVYANQGAEAPVAPSAGPHIVTVVFNGSTTVVYVNGTARYTGNIGAGGLSSDWWIGRHPSIGSRDFSGDISEVWAFAGALDETDRATLHSYAQDRYGITVSDYLAPGGAPAVTRRNLVPNPSFENNITDGFEQYGSTTAQSRDTAEKVFGSASLSMTAGAGSDLGQWARMTLPAGTYTASLWMKTASVDNNAAFVVRRPDTYATLGGTEYHVTGTTGWTRRSITFTTDGSYPVDMLVGLGAYGSTSGGTAWFDGLLLEKVSSADTYFDGGYSAAGRQVAWSGAANNSPSTETVTSDITVAAPSLGSTLAFGSVVATAGPVSVAVPSVASALALGPVTASASAVAAPAPLASTLAFGPMTATPGPVSVAVASRASTLAFGGVTATASILVAPAPLAFTLTFGPVGISAIARAEVPSRLSSVAFGPVTTSTSASMTPTGIASMLAFGDVSMTATANVSVSSVASRLAFGPVATSASVSALVDDVPGPLVTFGAVAVSATATVTPASLASPLAFGSVAVTARATVTPANLGSTLAFGPVTVSPGPASAPVPPLVPFVKFGPVTAMPIETLATTPTSLTSMLVFGGATVTPGPVTAAVPSCAPTLAFGAVTASSTTQVATPSCPSGLAFGAGAASSTATATPLSTASTLTVGPVAAVPGPVAALLASMASRLVFGQVTAAAGLVSAAVSSRASTLAFGSVTATPGPVSVAMPSMSSTLAFAPVTAATGPVSAAVASRASTLAFGSATATPGPVSVATPSRVSTLAFGAVATSASALVGSTPLASTLAFGPVSISAIARVEVPSLQVPVAAFTITLSPCEVVVAVESLLSALAFGGIASTQRRNLDIRVGRPRLSPWFTARPTASTGRPHGALATTRPTI